MKSFVSAANLFTQAIGNLLIVVLSKIRLFENQVYIFKYIYDMDYSKTKFFNNLTY